MAGGGNEAEEGRALLPRPSRLTLCLKQSKSCGRFVYKNCAMTLSLASLLIAVVLVATVYGLKVSHQDSEGPPSMQAYLYAILGVVLLGLFSAIRAHATASAAEAATVFQSPPLSHVQSAPGRLGQEHV